MVYDILKILKRSLKFWYIFAATFALGIFILLVAKIPFWHLTRASLNSFLIILFIIFFEIYIIGLFEIDKEVVNFDGEIEENFNIKVIVKNYNKHLDKLHIELNKINYENGYAIVQNPEEFKSVFRNKKLNVVKNEDFLQTENFEGVEILLVEVIKNEMSYKEINKILKFAETNNLKNIYIITRNKEKKVEGSISK